MVATVAVAAAVGSGDGDVEEAAPIRGRGGGW